MYTAIVGLYLLVAFWAFFDLLIYGYSKCGELFAHTEFNITSKFVVSFLVLVILIEFSAIWPITYFIKGLRHSG